jgi:hypothetical protein
MDMDSPFLTTMQARYSLPGAHLEALGAPMEGAARVRRGIA